MGGRSYSPADNEQLRQYCQDGLELQEIVEKMQRGVGGIVGHMWKLAGQDTSWRAFARSYHAEYKHILNQRPLQQADAEALIFYLMDDLRAPETKLAQLGFGKTLSLYPGGIEQARKDAENRRFLEAHRIYQEVVEGVKREVLEKVEVREASAKELPLVRAVFGRIPHFGSVSERLDNYVRVYMDRNPPTDLERYRSDAVASLSGLFISEIDLLLQGGEVRRIIEEALATLPEKEKRVIELRFLADKRHTVEKVGKELGVTRERIRTVEAKVLRKLRHPARSKRLKDYFREKRMEALRLQTEYRDPDVDLFLD